MLQLPKLLIGNLFATPASILAERRELTPRRCAESQNPSQTLFDDGLGVPKMGRFSRVAKNGWVFEN